MCTSKPIIRLFLSHLERILQTHVPLFFIVYTERETSSNENPSPEHNSSPGRTPPSPSTRAHRQVSASTDPNRYGFFSGQASSARIHLPPPLKIHCSTSSTPSSLAPSLNLGDPTDEPLWPPRCRRSGPNRAAVQQPITSFFHPFQTASLAIAPLSCNHLRSRASDPTDAPPRASRPIAGQFPSTRSPSHLHHRVRVHLLPSRLPRNSQAGAARITPSSSHLTGLDPISWSSRSSPPLLLDRRYRSSSTTAPSAMDLGRAPMRPVRLLQAVLRVQRSSALEHDRIPAPSPWTPPSSAGRSVILTHLLRPLPLV